MKNHELKDGIRHIEVVRKYGKRLFRLTETGLKIKVIREKGPGTALALKKRKEA